MTEPAVLLKDVGSVIATAATVVYGTGYLALRARARALGTEPGFKLLDQAYVFAGFRFVQMALFTLLLLSPLLWLRRCIPGDALELSASWILVILGILTLSSFAVFQCENALFPSDPKATWLHRKLRVAALGRNKLGPALVVASIGLAVFSTCWLVGGPWEKSFNYRTMLILLLAIQLLIAPICHGVFQADRYVRVLRGVPTCLSQVSEPICIVDRSADHTVVLGRSADGTPVLSTIRNEKLDSIDVVAVMHLRDFLDGEKPSRTQPNEET